MNTGCFSSDDHIERSIELGTSWGERGEFRGIGIEMYNRDRNCNLEEPGQCATFFERPAFRRSRAAFLAPS
jgi:hypothetical protein